VIVYDEGAQADLERIFEFNFERDPASALDHYESITEAVAILDRHPGIGRRVRPASTLRELVISYGKTGYVALYEHQPLDDVVRIVALRHQREAGYRQDA
jgi:plasmid stabilization system protein ParE